MPRRNKAKQDSTHLKSVKSVEVEIPETKYKYEQFLEICEISSKQIEDSKLTWNELAAVYNDQSDRMDALDSAARYIAERLRKSPKVHSVRARVKNPGGLVRKIIRKQIENSTRNISFANFRQQITDLVGIRALHLYKEDWLAIHNFILQEWDTIEDPIAYIREGDKSESYEQNGCKVKEHPKNYRSVHYLINCSGSKDRTIAEIQVRTLFEEAWSEVDHQINYPVAAPYNIVTYYLELFNRYAGSADEMGSFLPVLVEELRTQELEMARVNSERDDALKKAEELIKKSKMDATEKLELKKELEKALAAQFSPERTYGIRPNAGGLMSLSPLNFPAIEIKRRCTNCNCEHSNPLTISNLGLCEKCMAKPISIFKT
jgi:ppGpp synthetase/RelA/SpoT-type nucleotidyltranferase